MDLHYLFYVDAKQAVQIRSRNGLHFNGSKYNADVKFKNSLCNCAPSKIENHGAYKWVNPSKLRSIPKLPDELFNLIKNHERTTTIPNVLSPMKNDKVEIPTCTEEDHKDFRSLTACLSINRLNNYQEWINLGICLKTIGAPMSIWEEASKRSAKNKPGECLKIWNDIKPRGRS
jgi:hypothetical protein